MNIIELTFLIIRQVGTVTRLLSDSDSCPTALYFLLFKVITQIWDIKIDPNLHRLLYGVHVAPTERTAIFC